MEFENTSMIEKIKKYIIDRPLIAMGIALYLIQFFSNRSLWLDEAFIANNIISRNFLQLLNPLDYNQVAPIGFLLFTKLFSFIIPNSELGLRAFPLLCSISSIVVFDKICRLLFQNKLAITFCLSLFIFNNSLIYFASELKQYISDVFVVLILYYTTIKYAPYLTTKYVQIIATGSICIIMSNITPIVLICSGIYITIVNLKAILKSTRLQKITVLLVSVWLGTFLMYYLLFLHNHPTKSIMIEYWSNAGGFILNKPYESSFWQTLLTKVLMVFYWTNLKGIIGAVFISLFFIGLLSTIYCRKYRFIILFILPVIIHLTLSSFKLYPFDTRLVLYSAPLYIIIVTTGFEKLLYSKHIQKYNNPFMSGLIALLFMAHFFFSKPFPIEREEIKKTFSYIKQKKQDSLPIYIYYGAKQAFNYYQNTNIFNSPNKLILGESSRDNRNKYIDDIKQIKEPFWLLFSHPFENEDTFIIQKLDSLGYSRTESFEVTGASVYLFGEN